MVASTDFRRCHLSTHISTLGRSHFCLCGAKTLVYHHKSQLSICLCWLSLNFHWIKLAALNLLKDCVHEVLSSYANVLAWLLWLRVHFETQGRVERCCLTWHPLNMQWRTTLLSFWLVEHNCHLAGRRVTMKDSVPVSYRSAKLSCIITLGNIFLCLVCKQTQSVNQNNNPQYVCLYEPLTLIMDQT